MAHPYDVLDLKQLKCFWAVARHGSLTRAGVELGVSESAVAQRLRALERELGRKLYVTPGGRVRLTTTGERVFEMATRLFEEIDGFRRELDGAETAGSLRVAAEESVLLYLLPPAIRRFTDAHPKVHLEVMSRPPSEIAGLVQRAEADVGIVSYRPFPDSLVFRAWREFPGYLIAPLGHPLLRRPQPTLRDVARYPLVLPERGTGIYERVREILDAEGLPLQVALEVGTWETVKLYVAQGLGIAAVSGICLTESDRARLDAREIPAEYLASTTYGVLLRRDKYPSPGLRAFLTSLDPKFTGVL